jgi:indolepyruvate ferredoxin oxidoreductase, beta subunit
VNEGTVRVRPITIAVLAIGGEGGGVLADWIASLAEQNGYLAQATSVPGVAQRTGATIYYVELFPAAAAKSAGRDPVLALMPVPGDVDIVLASELMEAARAVERGLVTRDRTTLIASTHRVYAMSERTALADGRVDSVKLVEVCGTAARKWVAFDMAAMAEAASSAISAVLFGALAGSGALPFPRAAFEATIRRSGVGVAASLTAFGAGFEAANAPPTATKGNESAASHPLPAAIEALLQDASVGTSPDTVAVLRSGAVRLIDYQDADYARLYLERLRSVRAADRRSHGRLFEETARQLALAMSYEDTIRVADLKTRRSRFERVRDEVKLRDGQILTIAEFLHPRIEEIADTMPAGIGRWLLRTPWARGFVGRFTKKGRTLETTSIRGFLLLYIVASLRRWRRGSLRFQNEHDSIETWLRAVIETAAHDYDLAVEVARLRGLVKGYGDTHARGREKYELIARRLPAMSESPKAAERLKALMAAANADENGDALRVAMQADVSA